MKSKTKKKIISYILTFLICSVIGFSIGFVSARLEIPSELTILPWYINVLIIVVIYVVAVALHELGHAYSFIKNGIKTRAMFVIFFFFVKENGRWSMKFRPNNVTFLGGIAIPDLEAVKTNQEIDRLQKAYAKAILFGPIASIIVWAVLTIVSVMVILVSSNALVSSIFYTIAASITLISLFLLSTCFVKNDVAIGDFPAYRIAKNDRFFIAMQLYQYGIFATDYERVRAENDYLRSVLVEGLENKLAEQDTHIYTVGLLDQFIIEYLAGTIDELPNVIWDYVDFLTDDSERLSKIISSDLSLVTFFRMVQLLYTQEETSEKAMDLYTTAKKEMKPNTPMRKYLIKQTDHVLGLEDNSAFLRQKDNICISPAHGIWKNFDGYYADDLKLNQMYTAINRNGSRTGANI